MSHFKTMKHPSSSDSARTSLRSARHICRLQYGPCWCHGLPGETGSFDFVRTSFREVPLGDFDRNILILPERVIDGSGPVFLQFHDRVASPRLVVATAACPAAAAFWDDLPMGWSSIHELVPVDIHIGECISGYPDALMAAVLSYAAQPTSDSPEHTPSFSTVREVEPDALAR